MTQRIRADLLLLQRGLFDSRARAQAAIAAGLVTANGAVVKKPSEGVLANAAIVAEEAHPYVSRGGVKLAAALERYGIAPKGRDCVDVGSSTGGFTEVLLQRGAAHVTAVDTGTGQMHATLIRHPRLSLRESEDIRNFSVDDFPRQPDLAVIDVSFISLALVLPAIAEFLTEKADIVALIKPEFEVGRANIGRGGIVRDETAQLGAIEKVRNVLTELGFTLGETMESPITGGDGNHEYFVHAHRDATA